MVSASLRIAAGALSGLLLAAAAAPAPASAAEVPAELAALEQKTAQLSANTERFAFQAEVALNEDALAGIPFALIIDGRGEASVAPSGSHVEASLLGTEEFQTTTVGESEWLYERSAGESDGGRPWVRRKKQKAASEPSVLDPGGSSKRRRRARRAPSADWSGS